MMIKKRRCIVYSLFLLIFILFLLNACKSKHYSGKAFSYPPNSKPHETNWVYSGFVKITSSKSGPFYQKSKKYIHITVVDRKDNYILDDKFERDCGGIEINIKWDKFEVLEIILNEEGSEYVDDDYNKQLLKEGPRELIILKYNFNQSLHKFVRV